MATQLNFAQQMDAVLKTLDGTRPRLLLHACCGPCSSAVLEQLCQYFEITVLYYNPNTWPAEEYHRRGEELKKFVAAAHPLGVTVVEDHYDPQEFYSAVTGLENEPERGSRCTICYRLRMRRAAQYASENGFDWFTTTLSISPHKDAKRINAIGQELEAEFGVKHLPSDFKKHNGYLRSLLEATGSMMPMLVTLVMRPALATAVGFRPAIENANANSSAMAMPCVSARTSST